MTRLFHRKKKRETGYAGGTPEDDAESGPSVPSG
jgi:hypothetical protein